MLYSKKIESLLGKKVVISAKTDLMDTNVIMEKFEIGKEFKHAGLGMGIYIVIKNNSDELLLISRLQGQEKFYDYPYNFKHRITGIVKEKDFDYPTVRVDIKDSDGKTIELNINIDTVNGD